jgi:branched-chain amino acid transport system ATP-binding protein
MSNKLLEVKNIETYYGRIRALHGVSFEVEEGQVTAILGNNGAGKTTVLNSIMGLLDDQPEKGSIYFQGQRIHLRDTEKIVKMGIGYVPEGREIFEELTVKENLLIGAYLRTGKKAVKADIDHMYSLFPILGERQNQLGGTLSGGEQQMLAICRALMNKPKLLLLDEPSLGLSPLLVKEIFEIFPKIKEEGVTILIVEQNANMALSIADFGYVMENGRFVTSGTAEELKENEDVKEFYLGIKSEVSVKGYQRYKRKKRWR